MYVAGKANQLKGRALKAEREMKAGVWAEDSELWEGVWLSVKFQGEKESKMIWGKITSLNQNLC